MSTYWKVPVAWAGETVAVLASGPSMSALRDSVQRLRGVCRVIAVNNQGIRTQDHLGQWHEAIAPWADVLYAADRKWWWENRDEAEKFEGLRVSISQAGEAKLVLPFEVNILRNGGQHGYDDRPDHIRTGCNSGYQAVQLAAKFGAKRVLLVGFDMRASGRYQHWFGEHKWRANHRSPYCTFLHMFNASAKVYAERGVEILNCTPGSALRCFDMADLNEVIDGMQKVRRNAEETEGVLVEEAV